MKAVDQRCAQRGGGGRCTLAPMVIRIQRRGCILLAGVWTGGPWFLDGKMVYDTGMNRRRRFVSRSLGEWVKTLKLSQTTGGCDAGGF